MTPTPNISTGEEGAQRKSGKVQGSAREHAITTLEGFGNIAFLGLAHERLIDLDFTWLYYCTVVRFTKFKQESQRENQRDQDLSEETVSNQKGEKN